MSVVWAITPFEVGAPVGARLINEDWPLAEGETFTVAEGGYSAGMVLAADEASLEPAPEGVPA